MVNCKIHLEMPLVTSWRTAVGLGPKGVNDQIFLEWRELQTGANSGDISEAQGPLRPWGRGVTTKENTGFFWYRIYSRQTQCYLLIYLIEICRNSQRKLHFVVITPVSTQNLSLIWSLFKKTLLFFKDSFYEKVAKFLVNFNTIKMPMMLQYCAPLRIYFNIIIQRLSEP
jgi:hypothetical protein